MKRTRNLIIIVVALGAIIAVAAFAGRRGPAPQEVTVVTIKPTTFVTKLPETGIVQRPRVETIPTLVAGNVGRIYARPGDTVSAGQLLATVLNPSLQSNAATSQADYDSAVANIRTAKLNEQNARVGYVANVQTAKSNLAEAQRVYHADVMLFQNKAIPRNTLDADKAKLDQAQVAYDQAVAQLRLGAVTGYGQDSVQYAQSAAQKAQIVNQSNQQQLGFTQIAAPFSGVIQTLATQPSDPLTPIHPGDPVTAGQALFTIASSSVYIVKAEVDEQDVINVHPGQIANVTGEDFPGKTLVGHVSTIAPVAIKSTDPSSTAKQVLTTIQLDRSPDFLRDGMTVDVDILTTDVPHAILVPTAALAKDGSRSYVYVVSKGKAVKTYVATGASNDTQTVVKSGLAPGDRVISQTGPLLHDGAVVKVQKPTAHPTPSA